jgi:hypothetical protein
LFVRHRRYSDVHCNGHRTFATFNPVPSAPIPDRSGEAFFRHGPSLPPRRARHQRQPVPYAQPFLMVKNACALVWSSFSLPVYGFVFVRPPYFAPYDAIRVILQRTYVISDGPTSRVSVRFIILLLSSPSSTSISFSLTCLLSISRSQPSAPVLGPCVSSWPTRTRTLLTCSPV